MTHVSSNLKEWDALVSSACTILQPHFEHLDAHFERRQGLVTVEDLLLSVTPLLHDEDIVRLHGLSSVRSIHHFIRQWFAEAARSSGGAMASSGAAGMMGLSSSGGGAQVTWPQLVEHVTEAQRRHWLRMSQIPIPSWEWGEAFVPIPASTKACARVTAPLDGAVSYCLFRDVKTTDRVLEFYNERLILDEARTSLVAKSLTGSPTAFCFVPAPFSQIVTSYAANTGSTLGFVGVNGAVVREVPILSHFTHMTWQPRLSRLVCGSCLGELSMWLPTGKKEFNDFQAHNGPVLALDHLRLNDFLLSIGTDGKLALTDPGTLTGFRSAKATEEAVTCAAISPQYNLAAVGASNQVVLWNASLPPLGGTYLRDIKDPHGHLITDLKMIDDQVLSLDAGGLLKCWDLRMMKCVVSLKRPTSEEAKTAVYSKLFSLERDAVIATSNQSCVGAKRGQSSAHNVNLKAANSPILFAVSVTAFWLCTATSSEISIWSTKLGELIATIKGGDVSTAGAITALTADATRARVYVGYEHGQVTTVLLDPEGVPLQQEGGSATTVCVAMSDHSPVRFLLATAAGCLYASGPSKTVTIDISGGGETTMRVASEIDGIRDVVQGESFGASSVVLFSQATAMLFILEAAESNVAVVEDYREYELGCSLLGDCGPVFALLGSTSGNAVAVADGADVSIISYGLGRCTRQLSLPSMRSRVVGLAYEASRGKKSLLVCVESDGTVVVYDISDIAAMMADSKSLKDVDVTRCTSIHCVFQMTAGGGSVPHSAFLFRFFGACAISTADGGFSVHRYDGVRVGDLDMHQSGAGSWLPMVRKGGRGARRSSTAAMMPNSNQKTPHTTAAAGGGGPTAPFNADDELFARASAMRKRAHARRSKPSLHITLANHPVVNSTVHDPLLGVASVEALRMRPSSPTAIPTEALSDPVSFGPTSIYFQQAQQQLSPSQRATRPKTLTSIPGERSVRSTVTQNRHSTEVGGGSKQAHPPDTTSNGALPSAETTAKRQGMAVLQHMKLLTSPLNPTQQLQGGGSHRGGGGAASRSTSSPLHSRNQTNSSHNSNSHSASKTTAMMGLVGLSSYGRPGRLQPLQLRSDSPSLDLPVGVTAKKLGN